MTIDVASQQVSWWTVHEFVEPLLAGVGAWPMAGTPEWCALDDTDPVKTAALLDAAQHWALRVDTYQEQRCEAGRAVAGAFDWSTFSRKNLQRNSFYEARPWLKRVQS